MGRETLLYPVNWENEWPEINQGIPSEVVDMKNYPKHQHTLINKQELTDFYDTFDQPILNPEWLSLRNSLEESVLLKNSTLTLNGRITTIEQEGTPAFLRIRQTEQAESFTVIVSADTTINNGKIGILSLINDTHFATILVIEQNNEFVVSRYQKVEELIIEEDLGTLGSIPIQFELINQSAVKTFTVIDGKETLSFGTSSLHFSNEAIAALNTGDIQGIYVLDDAAFVVDNVRRKANSFD
ncbi:hypothetical protein IGI39_004308 [Enterococcus sp. AZ135]|uniref:beta-xylosidase family glycoside hydrolase n=1 Tax=unclassified Enterococcus TaxID=2608891 RepID=UPI003F235BE8